MKKLLSLIFCICLPFSAFYISCEASPDISASSAVVMNAFSKEVLFSFNENQKRGMASTTKIMTSLLAAETGKFNKKIAVNKDDVSVEGTSVGLKNGDVITLEDLIYAMLLESGNDAANVTATALSGNHTAFCDLMNKKAAELGMKNTHFANPSGLPDKNHYSTAFDMALLASYAVCNPLIRNICSKKSAVRIYGKPECSHIFSNHNKLLSMYDGCIGMKTGFTKSSGRCLVSAAEKNGVILVAVTLNAPDDWNDHIKLLDYGFKISKKSPVAEKDLFVNVVGSPKSKISVYYKEKTLPFGEYSNSDVYLEKFLYAPVNENSKVGKIVYKDNGKVFYSVDLYTGESAGVLTKPENKDKNIFSSIFNFLKDLF